MASDGCNQIGEGYGPITTSFAPGELSTIVFGGELTSVYNLTGLPCPPSSIEVPPGDAYAPLLGPPSFIYDLDPAFSTCIAGYSQGVAPPIDPPIAYTRVQGGLLSPSTPGVHLPHRNVGARARPHLGPSGPVKTVDPKHKVQL